MRMAGYVALAAFLVLAVQVPAGAALIGHWAFDGNANDSSAKANHGTAGGSITYQADTPAVLGGQSARSNGTGGANVVTVPTSPSMESINDGFTISYWMKAATGDNGNWVRIFQHGTEGNPSQTWLVDRYTSSNRVNVRVDTMGAGGQHNQNIATGGGNVFDSTWHHVVFTVESGNWVKYEDGNQVQAGTYKHGQGLSNTRPLYIFGRNGGGQYVGFLDEVALYDKALARNQVQYLSAGKDPAYLPVPAWMTVAVYDGTNHTMATADAARGSNVTGAPTNPPDNPGHDVISLAHLGSNGGSQRFPGTRSPVPAPGGGDSYAVFLTGYLRVDNSANPGGMWTFGSYSDDNSRIRIDLDQDGILEGSLTGIGGIANETVVYQGGCCNDSLGPTIAVPDGVYLFEAVYTEGGGGDYGEFFYAPGATGTPVNSTNWALIGDGRLGISLVAVPEPMTVLALGLSIAGLSGYVRRRRKV